MSSSIKVRINDTSVRVLPGATLLDATRAAGIFVPSLCDFPGLKPRPVCRACMVEVSGRSGLVPACVTPAQEGMAVQTGGRSEAIRRTVIELILAEHGQCGRADCEVEALGDHLGIQSSPFAGQDRTDLKDHHSDHLSIRLAGCVHCDRCIRACDQRGVLTRSGRGTSVRVAFDDDRQIADSRCVGCGDCVAVCPAGGFLEAQ